MSLSVLSLQDGMLGHVEGLLKDGPMSSHSVGGRKPLGDRKICNYRTSHMPRTSAFCHAWAETTSPVHIRRNPGEDNRDRAVSKLAGRGRIGPSRRA